MGFTEEEEPRHKFKRKLNPITSVSVATKRIKSDLDLSILNQSTQDTSSGKAESPDVSFVGEISVARFKEILVYINGFNH